MLEMPPYEIVETVQEKEVPRLLGRPNCPHPATGILAPNEEEIYDGWITLKNNTDLSVYVSMRFTLKEGYSLKLLDEDNHILLSEKVLINKSYDIVVNNDSSSLCLLEK